ncbi:MAG TPA: hypothetical protein DCZ94_04590 [Lentisphaeria bacterium]|nr:MAG: hypothetical protein A2X48_20180 [Lentisphaerae bacterium GWF2_49_21]HBC86213.1 hypothetical protein [Lentisphaeria bacterium]
METLLIYPPVAFLILLLAGLIMSALSSKIAFKGAKSSPGKLKSYGCGEDIENPRLQPDYSQFFSFAFFFTIMHVVVLMIATAPADTIRLGGMAFLYLIIAVSGLFILFRR